MSRRTKISKLRNAKRRLKIQVGDLQNKVNDLQEQRDTLTCHDVGGFRSWWLGVVPVVSVSSEEDDA